MHVLIIGGTGLTGKNIVKMLIDRGYHLTIFHRGNHPLELSDEDLLKVNEIYGDRTKPEDLEQLRGLNVDFLVDMVMRTEAEAQNIVNLFKGKLRHAIHISSADVYRVFDVILGKDKFIQSIPVKEDAELRHNLYPFNTDYDKITAERVILQANTEGVYPATILRFPAIYGPGQDTGLFREWFIVKRIIDGEFQVPLPDGARTYFHHGFTENLAHAVVLTIEKYQQADKVYNVADEQVFTTRQLFELAEEIFDVEFTYHSIPFEEYTQVIENNPYGINSNLLLDIKKIKEDLGYKDLVNSREAMERTFHWLKENPRPDDYLLNPDYQKEKELIKRFIENN